MALAQQEIPIMFKSFLKIALVALSLATVTGLAKPEIPTPSCFPCDKLI